MTSCNNNETNLFCAKCAGLHALASSSSSIITISSSSSSLSGTPIVVAVGFQYLFFSGDDALNDATSSSSSWRLVASPRCPTLIGERTGCITFPSRVPPPPTLPPVVTTQPAN